MPLDNIRYNDYIPFMDSTVRQVAKGRGECEAGGGPEQDVFLGVLKTADVLQAELAAVLKPADLSATQYNVLRILRGAGDEGMACGRITERMLTHDPDMTRLLDRLEKRGLITRGRDAGDRRVVRARVTATAGKLLAGLDEPVARLHRTQLGHLGRRDLKSLAELLRRARELAP
ncbi:MAG: transcriptional regulator, MarR family [Phycisphaerales bacterium]|nr:transcriptional regulator, MarR family [Phycisphaerales bacterium]